MTMLRSFRDWFRMPKATRDQIAWAWAWQPPEDVLRYITVTQDGQITVGLITCCAQVLVRPSANAKPTREKLHKALTDSLATVLAKRDEAHRDHGSHDDPTGLERAFRDQAANN